MSVARNLSPMPDGSRMHATGGLLLSAMQRNCGMLPVVHEFLCICTNVHQVKGFFPPLRRVFYAGPRW